jgi:hypothetical protein
MIDLLAGLGGVGLPAIGNMIAPWNVTTQPGAGLPSIGGVTAPWALGASSDSGKGIGSILSALGKVPSFNQKKPEQVSAPPFKIAPHRPLALNPSLFQASPRFFPFSLG